MASAEARNPALQPVKVAKPKEGEKKVAKSKRARFLELAPKRVTVALKKIGYVKNLANKASYEYTAEEAKRIQEALWGAVDLVVKAFEGQAEKPSGFTF